MVVRVTEGPSPRLLPVVSQPLWAVRLAAQQQWQQQQQQQQQPPPPPSQLQAVMLPPSVAYR
jgi:hypothetical protein